MQMIPSNRPVVGKDLDVVRQSLGLLTADACWLFGLSITRWMQIVRQAPETPVKDPTLAILVRFLANHPEVSIIPRFPSAQEMFDFVNTVQSIDKKRFSVMMGSEASATYRWLNSSSRQSPAVSRLMFFIKTALLSRRPEQRAEIIEEWRKLVTEEATARGAQDIFKTCQWGAAPTKKSPAAAEPVSPELGGPGHVPKRGRRKPVVHG